MPALLRYGEQAFWVSNAAKDLLYEVAVEVAARADPVAHQFLMADGRLVGCYGVSGLGFDLDAFAEAFGGPEAWWAFTARHFAAVEQVCGNPDCVRHMTKVFAWVGFLLSGGRCNDAAGRHPDYLTELPVTEKDLERPGRLAGRVRVAELLLADPPLGDDAVGRRVGVSQHTVAAVRRALGQAGTMPPPGAA